MQSGVWPGARSRAGLDPAEIGVQAVGHDAAAPMTGNLTAVSGRAQFMHSPHTSVSVLGLDMPPVCPIAVQLVVADPLAVGVPVEPLG